MACQRQALRSLSDAARPAHPNLPSPDAGDPWPGAKRCARPRLAGSRQRVYNGRFKRGDCGGSVAGGVRVAAWLHRHWRPRLPPRAGAAGGAARKCCATLSRCRDRVRSGADFSDLYSRTIAAESSSRRSTSITWRGRSRCSRHTAHALPEVSDDFTTFTFRSSAGIYLPMTPRSRAHGGANSSHSDYVYSIKRHYDPRWKSPTLYPVENVKLLGLTELRQQALTSSKPFHYDREVEACAPWTATRCSSNSPNPSPRFHRPADRQLRVRRDGARSGRVLRRQDHGASGGHRPVPARRMAARSRSCSRETRAIGKVLRRRGAARRPQAVAANSMLKGKRLPLLDRIEISIIEATSHAGLHF